MHRGHPLRTIPFFSLAFQQNLGTQTPDSPRIVENLIQLEISAIDEANRFLILDLVRDKLKDIESLAWSGGVILIPLQCEVGEVSRLSPRSAPAQKLTSLTFK